jgi:hypothetical protein
MTSHLGVFLDWSVIDLVFVAIGVQQYISVTRDLKRTRAREAAEAQAVEPERAMKS